MSTNNEFFTNAEIEKFTLPEDYRDIDSLHATISMDVKNITLADKRKRNLQRNSSAYALFFRENQPLIRSQNKNLTFGDVSKAIASKWEQSSDQLKKEYKKRVQTVRKEELMQKAFFKATSILNSPDTKDNH